MSAVAADIFISYAREDMEWVRPLAAELEARGWSVFWDKRIPAGENWHSHIGASLRAARSVVVVWSDHSVESEWVLEEANQGKRRRTLVPVLKDPVEPPVGFGLIQAADLSTWARGRTDEEFAKFLEDLARVLAGPQAPAAEPAAAPPRRPPAAAPPAARPRAGERLRRLGGIAAAVVALGMVIAVAQELITAGRGVVQQRAGAPAPAAPAPAAGPVVAAPAVESGPAVATVAEAATVVRAARRGGQTVGQVFADTLKDGSPCGFCPEMVVVPPGSFTMGSPADEAGRAPDEGPQRTVAFAQAFAIGRYEITFDQWAACVAGGGCAGYLPDDQGWGMGSRPVINVTWDDARGFVAWLSRQTGLYYRLPSEAEWEYAARGGTKTPFWTGPTTSADLVNYDGDYVYAAGQAGPYRGRSVPVDAPGFPANPFGLFHVHGNVLEWVQDCYAGSYAGAPVDGHVPADRGDCEARILRGGSWVDDPRDLRAANRTPSEPDDRYNFAGFRVARMISK